jgi:hypothetical protein
LSCKSIAFTIDVYASCIDVKKLDIAFFGKACDAQYADTMLGFRRTSSFVAAYSFVGLFVGLLCAAVAVAGGPHALQPVANFIDASE